MTQSKWVPLADKYSDRDTGAQIKSTPRGQLIAHSNGYAKCVQLDGRVVDEVQGADIEEAKRLIETPPSKRPK